MNNLDIDKLRHDVEKLTNYTNAEAIRLIINYIDNLQKYMMERLNDRP